VDALDNGAGMEMLITLLALDSDLLTNSFVNKSGINFQENCDKLDIHFRRIVRGIVS